MARPVDRHWLRENTVTRSPHRVLVVDTETRAPRPSDPGLQALRLWSARFVRRHENEPGKPRREDFRGRTATELADLVEKLARSDRALWLFTHNLSFDLAVTALPVHLVERGWHLTQGALSTDAPWCRLARGTRRLTIADSWSFLPASVEALGRLLHLPKVALPGARAGDDAWWLRCDRDVEITARALLELIDWWDAGAYGSWSLTGPATGWSSYRHVKPPPRVLIDPDPEARALELRAVNGGRREAMRVGDLGEGLYANLDLALAHLTVMAELPLPKQRSAHFERLPLNSNFLNGRVVDVLAEVELEVATPRYPWDSGRGIFHPVGRFRTVLAGPEIRAARARGELVAIGPGYAYHLSRHMAAWALWVAGLLATETAGVPPAARLAAKQWSRSVAGKWAGHTSETLEKWPDPRPGWSLERGSLMPGRRKVDFLRLGGERWTIARDVWSDDAFPAVLAWIQSYVRVAIGRLLDCLGPAALSVSVDGALVDVDSVWTSPGNPLGIHSLSASDKLRRLAELCTTWNDELAPFTVRVKRAWRRAVVLGPQHLLLDGERRLAGIPKRAVVLADGRLRFTQWPKLHVQLRREQPGTYRVVEATVDLPRIPPTGWLLASGRVSPLELSRVDGRDVPQPPPAYAVRPPSLLAPPERQHPLLRHLLAP